MRARALLFSLLFFTAVAWGQAKAKVRPIAGPEERTAKYLESVRKQPSLLLAFLRAMPKGADLHNHLSGAIYAESYIKWAAEDGLCVNRQTLAFVSAPCDPEKGMVPAQQALTDSVLYGQVVNAQSMRFFTGPESGHDHFFNAFGKFGLVSRTHQGDMLAEVVSRAASQKLSMVALLLAPDKGEVGRFVTEHKFVVGQDFAAARKSLLDAGLSQVVERSRGNLDSFEKRMREVLKCGAPQADKGCDVTVRYQYEIHRGLSPDVVFTEMVAAFELASADPRVLDVNPVMPEDGFVELRDFDLHMKMIEYLHGAYPKVHLSLHAGELWQGLVRPNELRDHIRKSVEVGHAERIGHGVDVMFEDDPVGLLKEMASKKIAVEINLTSNDMILGVGGMEHPLAMYLKVGVPVTISTDDEGVARSDITHEYMKLMREHDVTYSQVKQMVRNSLEYSFLPASERAEAQRRLERDFVKFETGECCKIR